MGLIVYLNGEFLPVEEARISVFDHGFLYGDGVFEGIRAYNGRVFRLRQHLDRLYDSAHSIGLDIGMPKEEMLNVVLETVRRNGLRDAYIRLVVARGVGDLGLDPRKCKRPTVLCIAAHIQLYPQELYEKGLELVTVATRRNLPEAINPRIKSLNYLNNILAKIEATLAGASEGLMLNQEGYVAEATGDNIFLVKQEALITPPSHVGILEGITRNAVMELAARQGLEVREEVFTRYDVYTADECFLTGTAAEIIPVAKLDGRTIGKVCPGRITRMLMRAFHELTQVEGEPIYFEAAAASQ
ncbi:MAG: branched-chain-amino-acid transaminase [Moorellales bacterium]